MDTGEQVQVIAAVAVGHHDALDKLVDRVLAALREANLAPSGFDMLYGSAGPVPGRDGDPCDMATVVVPTGYQR